MPMANVYNRRLGFKDPEGGDFSLYIFSYWPNDAILNGRWTPPAVVAV